MGKIADWIKTTLSGENQKGAKILIALGIAGIALIFISGFFGGASKQSKTDATAVLTNEEYTDLLEKRLKTMITGITGNERVSVMITLRQSEENVYLNDLKTDTDVKTEASSGGAVQQKGTNEQSYITVRDADGNETALLVTSFSPTVQGVVVVCDTAGNDNVKIQVEEAVKIALDLSSRKVCVISKKGN